MTVSRRDALFTLGVAAPASALLLSVARGQGPAGAPPAGMGQDPLLAGCLLITGRKQIENCTYVLNKLQSDDAKAFAKAEIDEHQTIKANLQKLGYAYPVQPAAGAGAGGTPPRWAVTAGPVPLSPDAAGLVSVDHEVADQCILNFRTEMDQLTGTKLDKRFVGHQLDMHFSLRDHAQVFRRHASAAMAPTLDEGLKIIEQHIATLKRLMEKV